MLLGLFVIPLGEPVFRGTGLQAEVIPPVIPRIASEANFDFAEGRYCFPVFAQVCEVAAQIDERICLGLDDIALARDLKALLIPLERVMEVLQLAVEPPDAVRHARDPEPIAVPSGHLHRLMERRQGVRDPPTVALDKPEHKEADHEVERIAYFSSETEGFAQHRLGEFVLGLEEVHARRCWSPVHSSGLWLVARAV